MSYWPPKFDPSERLLNGIQMIILKFGVLTFVKIDLMEGEPTKSVKTWIIVFH